MLEAIKQKELEVNEEDYTDEETGLLICGKCNTPKQCKVNWLNEKEIVVTCLCKCEEEEIEREKLRERERQEKLRWQIRRQSIAVAYRDICFEDSDIKLEKAENYVNNFQQFYEENIGLMIFGEVGNGKTFTASAIANELCNKGYTVLMLHTTDALRNTSNFEEKESFVEEVRNADLLILDDFGASRDTEYQNEQLNLLIDTRYAIKKPLIITTNLTRKDLLEPKDLSLKRTYDRVIEMTHPLFVESKGRRVNIAKKRYEEVESMLKGDLKGER